MVVSNAIKPQRLEPLQFPTKDRSDSYLLRIQLPDSTDEDYLNAPRDSKGYLFPAGIPGELAALFSLHFRARFYILSTTYGEMTATSIPIMQEHSVTRGRYGAYLDPIVFSDEPREFHTSLATYLDSIRDLPAPHHQFTLAAHHYSQALRDIGMNEEMVDHRGLPSNLATGMPRYMAATIGRSPVLN